jgi:chromosome segregation ATPase
MGELEQKTAAIKELCEMVSRQSHELEQIRERRAEAVRLNEAQRQMIHELEEEVHSLREAARNAD